MGWALRNNTNEIWAYIGCAHSTSLSLVFENEFWNWRSLWMEQTLVTTLPLPREIVHYSVLYLNCVRFLQALDLEFNYCRQFKSMSSRVRLPWSESGVYYLIVVCPWPRSITFLWLWKVGILRVLILCGCCWNQGARRKSPVMLTGTILFKSSKFTYLLNQGMLSFIECLSEIYNLKEWWNWPGKDKFVSDYFQITAGLLHFL